MKNLNIIGAGIGGLTTAIALQQKGIESRVYEQAAEIKPVGAGIILANNAMQVYEKLGLREAIEAQGNPISAMKITQSNLKPISSIDLAYFEKKYQVRNIAIHRGKLQQVLARQIPQDRLKLGYQLSKVIRNSEGFELNFENGQAVHSQLVLGADGIDSIMRNQLFTENKIRNASQICWRGIANLSMDQSFQHELNEAWGQGDRLVLYKLPRKKCIGMP